MSWPSAGRFLPLLHSSFRKPPLVSDQSSPLPSRLFLCLFGGGRWCCSVSLPPGCTVDTATDIHVKVFKAIGVVKLVECVNKRLMLDPPAVCAPRRVVIM